MKKIKMIIFLFMIGFICQSINVYAISGDFEYKNVHYSIKKVYMEVYQSKLDSDGKFVGYNPTKISTIDLDDTFTIAPQYIYREGEEEEGYSNVQEDNMAVALNLNATKEDLLSLLKENVDEVDASHHYYIRMVVDYSIDSTPDEYQYLLQSVYTDTNNELNFSTDGDDNSVKVDKISFGETYSQVFLNFEYKLDNSTEFINYSNTYTSDLPTYYDFYLCTTKLSSVDETKSYVIAADGVDVTSDDSIVVNEKYGLTISFVGYNNIESYEEALARSVFSSMEDFLDDFSNVAENPKTSGVTNQVIRTPNTGMMKDYGLLIGGFVVISLGSTLIYYSLKKGRKF